MINNQQKTSFYSALIHPASVWSLRRTLLAIVLGLTISVWIFSAIVVYLDADTESQELFDQSLAETAHLLLTLADHEVEEQLAKSSTYTLEESRTSNHTQNLLFQIWNEHHLLYKSQGAPDTAFAQNPEEGFQHATINGSTWRVYTTWDSKHHLQIQVGEPIHHRKEISTRFAYKLAGFAIIIIPLMTIIIWWSINLLFRTLRDSADEVSRRTPNDLHTVNVKGTPKELHALLNAINTLFERVSSTLEREQRFTADASHELRTPLAAIKTNLQVIQRARNDAERGEAIEGLSISVDRATRLVEQLLTLARLDPVYEQDPSKENIDLATFIASNLSDVEHLAHKQGIKLTTQLKTAYCLVNPNSLRILLRNLTDNAFRYTPKPGHVELACWSDEHHSYLTVSDSGTGIPTAMREQVFNRFFRLTHSTASGSGLGLSIVKTIVEAHQASITLEDGLDGKGLAVKIRFNSALLSPTQTQIGTRSTS